MRKSSAIMLVASFIAGTSLAQDAALPGHSYFSESEY